MSVVLCAQVHAMTVTGLMVGSVVAGYTGIIERGIEQPQGAKPMTTNQNANVSILDGRLDVVAGGAIAVPNLLEARYVEGRGRHRRSAAPLPISPFLAECFFTEPTDGDDI